ncbi:MAG: Na/Pi cotransporter family protein [Desulfobulbaceae bacterium]|nr:MAG: Na/Pi cotransporter family protein [Desulfobulbaceae bacterium]
MFKRQGVVLLLLTLLLFGAQSVWGAASQSQQIDWLDMGKGLFGGLALFLFGMEMMSSALKSALGSQMKMLLGKLTSNRFSAILTGTFVTAVVQSSSVTTVLVVGFVSAGMMSMAQSVGVIMGANIGTTVTAQIVAFKVEEAALWMIAVGFLMFFVSKRENMKHYGSMLMGLGLIFYGMGLMGQAMYPLRSYPPFLDLMARMANPVFAIAVAAGFTALVQSSSATTALVITMAGQGLITLEAGIALAFGSNIGTCVTALLASLGKPREAVRVAAVHVVFNIAGVLIWLPFIALLAGWVTSISPTHAGLSGTARLAAEVPRQIANAHTIFNVANTLIFIAFTTQIGRLVQRLIPEKSEPDRVIIKPEFLNDALLKTPSLALQGVQLEIARMSALVSAMFDSLQSAIMAGDRNELAEVKRRDDRVDVLQGEILRYLAALRKQELSDTEGKDIALFMRAVDLLESIGDVIETELVNIGYRVIDGELNASESQRKRVKHIGDRLFEAMNVMTIALKDLDQNAAQEILYMKQDIDQLLADAMEAQTDALAQSEVNVAETRMEMNLLNSLKQIQTYIKRIARLMLPEEIQKGQRR